MSYDYEEYRFTTNVDLGSDSGLYAGFVSRVDGEIGSAFKVATANGAMVGLYKVSVADGAIAAFTVDKTTKQNKGKLKLSAVTSAPSAKEASKLSGDTGFADVVTAVDGSVYRILTSAAYVVVNSSLFSYTLSAAQSLEAKEFFEDVKSYLASNNWRADWQKVATATLGTGVDVIDWAHDNLSSTVRNLMDDCVSILSEIPVVTYELDVRNGVDTEAPVVDASSVDVISMGSKIKAECTGAIDNFFVYGFEWQITDSNNVVVGEGIAQNGTGTIRPDTVLEDADYTFHVRAYDYAGNKSDWVAKAITISTDLYVDGETVNEATEPVPISQEQEVEQDTLVYTFNPEYSGSYNLILEGLDNNAKLTITEFSEGKAKKLKSKSMTVKNFMKGTGRVLFDMSKVYDISITSKYAASFKIAVEGEAFVLANQIPEDTWADMKTVQQVTPEMKVAVNAPDQTFISNEWVGFTDKLDVREINLTVASRLMIELTANNKSKLSVYTLKSGDKLKKVKSVSLGKSTRDVFNTKAISNLLLDVGTYFIVVEAPNAKKGVNANYGVKLNADGTEFYEQANPYEQGVNYVTEENPAKGWVGFGGAVNSFKFDAKEGGAFDLALTDTNNEVRMTIYDNDKKVKSVTSKNGSASTGLVFLDTGKTYLVELESTKAKKGLGSNYTVSVADEYKYNFSNNTMETATALAAPSTVKGIISNLNDPSDWYNLSAASGDIEIEAVSGKMTASFYDVGGSFLFNESLKKGQSVEYTLSEFNAAYVNIESADKKASLYSIALA